MDRPEAAYRADGPSILLRDDLAGTEMRFATPREVIRADHPDEVQAALDRMERTREAGKWCAGYVSYEAGYALEPKLRDIMPGGRRLPLVLMGVFNVGGGIVFDSEVRSEYDECLLKARFASGPDPKSCPRTDI